MMLSKKIRAISILIVAIMLLSVTVVPSAATEMSAESSADETDLFTEEVDETADDMAEEPTEEPAAENTGNEVYTEETDITASSRDRARPPAMKDPLNIMDKSLVYAANTGSRLKLAYDPETYNVVVHDVQNNTVWQTNPSYDYPNLNLDASMETRLKSHLYVEYIFDAADSGNAKATGGLISGGQVQQYYDSYSESILKNQLTVEPLEDGSGFDFIYNIGNMRPYDFPKCMKKETFEAFLESIPRASDRRKISSQYSLVSLNDFDQRIAEATELVTKNMLTDQKNIMVRDFPFLLKHDVYLIEQQLRWNQSFVKKTQEFEQLWQSMGVDYDQILEWYEESGFIDHWKLVGFTLPVRFKIEGDEFVASILTQDERCYIQPGLYITKVDFLATFASAELEEDGYFMMPDGSGAIVDINPVDGRFSEVSMSLYSHDSAFTQPASLPYFAHSTMPVFGIKREGKAIFAIIEGMSEYCRIFSKIGRSAEPYARIYPQFHITVFDEARYKGQIKVNRMILFPRVIVDGKKYGYLPDESISVRYKFLYGAEADYSGMAEAYRKYLIKNYDMQKITPKENIPFFVDLMGVIDKRVTFLGIPVTVKYSLTTFKEAQKILETLSENGIEHIVARYLGAANGGMLSEASNKVSIMRQLGGKRGLEAFKEYTDSKGYGLYLDFEMLYIYKDRMFDGFNPNSDSSYNLLGVVSIISQTNPSTGEPEGWWRPRYVVSPKYYDIMFGKFYDAVNKADLFTGVSMGSVGRDINSDYLLNNITSKIEAKESILRNVEKFKDSGYNILVEKGNAYVAPYADVILEIPVYSSKFYMEKYQIPFYQMVLHGYVEYAGEPLNKIQNTKRNILKSIEFGLGVYGKFMYNPDLDLFDTDFEDDHYSLHYKNWIEESSFIYEKVNSALRDIQDKTIVRHEVLEKSVVRVTYEGGTTFVLNYNAYPVTVDGRTIPAEDYIKIGG